MKRFEHVCNLITHHESKKSFVTESKMLNFCLYVFTKYKQNERIMM